MVQIVNMSPKPSMAGSFGEGFNQGFGTSLQRSIDAGLAYKLNDMLDAKKYARQQEDSGQRGIAALSVFKPNASDEEKAAAYALGPDMTIKLMQNLGESGFASFVASGKVPTGGQEQQQQTNVMGQPQAQTINIQGMPERQEQQQPPFMLPQQQQQQQQAQQSPQQVQQAQQPAIPQQAAQRAASMSDDEWNNWLSQQKISPAWKVKYSQARTKQQEMDLKQREDVRKERKDVREEARFQREMDQTPTELKPYVADVEAKRASIRGKENSINLAEQAVKSGGTSGFAQFFAEKFGIDPMKSGSTSLLNAAAKEFTLSNIRRAGSRPNMWIEQQIREMFPKAGKSDFANKVLIESLRLENDLDKKEVEIYDKLSAEDIERFGSVRKDIRKRIDDELKPYVESRSNAASLKIQELREENMDDKKLAYEESVPDGTPLTTRRKISLLDKFNGDKKRARDEAIKLGFKSYRTDIGGK